MNQIQFFSAVTALLLLTHLVAGQSPGSDPLQNCRASLNNDTLVIENDLMARRFLWNNGNLMTLNLTDKRRRQTWKWVGKEPDAALPDHAKTDGKGTFDVQKIINRPNQANHLEVSVTAQLGTLAVKRVFQVYPSVPSLSCTFYLRGKVSPEWKEGSVMPVNALDFNNIELQKNLNTISSGMPVMDKLCFAGNHWQLRPVEFFDMTDRNNTLVKETTYNLYRLPGFLTGNLLFLKDLTSDYSFFVLKEAPCSYLQLAPVLAKNGSIQTVGIGLTPNDVSENEWVRGYGYTLGFGGKTELETLQALRSYQDAKHLRRADLDEMILMNTWGDRNKETKLSESFILAELKQAARLGITHYQIDSGWQIGVPHFSGGSSENIWKDDTYWKVDPKRFPNGLKPVLNEAKKLGIQIGLWFSPSVDSSFKHWEQDAQTITNLHKEHAIRTFKIDLVQIDDKQGEINFRKMLDTVLKATNYGVIFNMDVTAGRRNGYHFMNEYGNLFLENRYTDWTNYYPYWTLRNLWNLSKYVPPQNLQIEFLNKWRNADKYPAGDRFAPANYSFDYLFAITMMAQPLAWFEATGLPPEAFPTGDLIKTYRTNQQQLHGGQIFPIGDEPSGKSWTGFQSLLSDKEGFLLVFREDNNQPTKAIQTWLPTGKRVRLEPIGGVGKRTEGIVTHESKLIIALPTPNSFVLYRYQLLN